MTSRYEPTVTYKGFRCYARKMTPAYTTIRVFPTGGAQFAVELIGGDEPRNFLGSIEVGELDAEGQWDGDMDDVAAAAHELAGPEYAALPVREIL